MAVRKRWPALLASALLLGAVGCGGDSVDQPDQLSGLITIEASEALAPFTQTAAVRFERRHPAVHATVRPGTTARAFERLCAGEVGIAAVSRPVGQREVEECRDRGVVFFDLPVAADAIAVVVGPDLPIRCLTTEQLAQLWAPQGARRYRDVGDDAATGSRLPDRPVRLYGPGPGSGAYDQFTQVFEDEPSVIRRDYAVVDHTRALTEAIADDPSGLGFLPFSAYRAADPPLRLLEVDDGDGCVAPRLESIPDGEYPLAHSLYVYPSRDALRRAQVGAFLRFVLDEHTAIAKASGTAALSDETASEAEELLARALD
jgi:phosphate transport system substrate-binding protein